MKNLDKKDVLPVLKSLLEKIDKEIDGTVEVYAYERDALIGIL